MIAKIFLVLLLLTLASSNDVKMAAGQLQGNSSCNVTNCSACFVDVAVC